MKLIFCTKCFDVVKLIPRKMRSCECGNVFGRYIDDTYAEVSDTAISLAIGNGSLINAIHDMKHNDEMSHGEASRESYHEKGKGLIGYAWVRPNEGNGNPHCKVIRDIRATKITVNDAKKILDNPL